MAELTDTTEETFDPELALARYRELEALLNLDLLTHPDWQRQRAQGEYEWLRTNKYFIEQEELAQAIDENGYDLIVGEEEGTGKSIYEIEKKEAVFDSPRL